MSRKSRSKTKVRGKAAKQMSAIGDFIWRLKRLEEKAVMLETHHVNVGWKDDAKEQQRAIPKQNALAMNARRKKGKGEIVSNFDADFVGPGIKAASLATIAKVMNYGRAGGVAKDGHEYGAIPARPFVDNLHKNHFKAILGATRDLVHDTLKKGSTPQTLQQQLARIGVVAKGQLQRAMKDSNAYEANAPITIKGGWMANPKNGKPFKIEPKGSSRPLWNSGTLIKSVDFEIK